MGNSCFRSRKGRTPINRADEKAQKIVKRIRTAVDGPGNVEATIMGVRVALESDGCENVGR